VPLAPNRYDVEAHLMAHMQQAPFAAADPEQAGAPRRAGLVHGLHH